MKTTNLTPWCNLFSSESKYNINVNKSCYKLFITAGSAVALILLAVIFFTYAYHFALTVAVVTFLLLGFLLNKQRALQAIVSTFELNRNGLCSFDGNHYYQLQDNSRFSFLGCWLVLQPIITANSIRNSKINNRKKRCFIYRVSLSKQDFSRISNIIAQLSHSP